MQRYFYNYPYLRYPNTNIKNNLMTVYGKGNIKVKPDIATASIGVVVENKDLSVAQAQSIEKANKILDTLKRMGIKERDIQTENYTITPEYDYIEGKQVFRTYKITNTFRVTLRELSRIGEIIDAAVASGANVVNNITFTIENPEKYYNQALKIAVRNALEKARELGDTLNVIVNNTPIRIIEERQEYRPVYRQAVLAASTEATPIMEGVIEINAEVKVILNYLAKTF
ncbi:SIMPL domain-containing protein [Clostridium aciditolerans]|uniref:SIMPL domain-containing protein n=1 Tax=Clostridium aciditolerans TaxID=339861 RepID=A0A934HX88_9CLOT|nr:SIMPL domain-containing protein [Clostridium aciditolerans]MBI6872662.1 SIMPL domain-containing protein [Clostridium aciditolerans]